MGLETGTGIGDLVPTNPLSTDAVSSGDDHIRLIKTVMQSITFFKSIQTFTASGTWTRPANVKKILIYCLGGGGGGGGGTVGSYAGGGGSSGATVIKWLDVSAIPSATVSIGSGGAGGAVGVNGAQGAYTIFAVGGTNHCASAPGDSGATAPQGGNAAIRSASIGDLIFIGGSGDYGEATGGATFVHGGTGGGSGGTADMSAQPNSGGGGGGGACNNATGFPGSAGGSGYCFVLEFGW